MSIIGCHWPDARRIRDFAARYRLPYRWLDLEQVQTAETLLRQMNVSPQHTPVVILKGQRVLRNPGNVEPTQAVRAEPVVADVHTGREIRMPARAMFALIHQHLNPKRS